MRLVPRVLGRAFRLLPQFPCVWRGPGQPLRRVALVQAPAESARGDRERPHHLPGQGRDLAVPAKVTLRSPRDRHRPFPPLCAHGGRLSAAAAAVLFCSVTECLETGRNEVPSSLLVFKAGVTFSSLQVFPSTHCCCYYVRWGQTWGAGAEVYSRPFSRK